MWIGAVIIRVYKQRNIMNLFDAVPFFVDQELGYEVDEENISSYDVQRVFKIVVDNCDNFDLGTLTPKNHMMIKRMVRNAISLMVSDDSEERDQFNQMVREVKQDLSKKVALA